MLQVLGLRSIRTSCDLGPNSSSRQAPVTPDIRMSISGNGILGRTSVESCAPMTPSTRNSCSLSDTHMRGGQDEV